MFFFLGVKKKVGVKKHFFASLFCFFSRAKSIFHARIFRIFPVFSRGNLLEKLQIHDFFRVLPVKIKQFCTGKSSHLRILGFFHGCENAFHAQKKKHCYGLPQASTTLISHKISKYCIFFYSKRASSPAGTEVETQKTENRPTYCDFGIWLPESPTSPNFKTHKRIILHNRNYIAYKVYTYSITCLSFIKI